MKKRIFRIAVCCAGLILLICFSQRAASLANEALETILFTLSGALLPYLFASALLSKLCFAPEPIAKTTAGAKALTLLIAFLCGFPGAQFALICARKADRIDRTDARVFARYLCAPSPAFCVSYFGRAVCSDPLFGLRIYLCACASCVLLCRLALRRAHQTRPPVLKAKKCNHPPVADPIGMLTSALKSSFSAFSKLSLGFLACKLCLTVPLSYLPAKPASLLYALIEPIAGSGRLQAAFASGSEAPLVFCAAFGGVCSTLFAVPIAKENGVRFHESLLDRALIAALSVCFFKIGAIFFDFL